MRIPSCFRILRLMARSLGFKFLNSLYHVSSRVEIDVKLSMMSTKVESYFGYYDSRHIAGHAVDLIPYINGKLRWEWNPICRIDDAVRLVAKEQVIPIL